MTTTEVKRAAALKWSQLRTYIMVHDFIMAIALTLGIVSVGLFLGWENNKIIPVDTTLALPTKSALSFMSNWDGPAYLSIAQHGYRSLTTTNYFPAYPLLIRFFDLVFRNPLYSGLLISWTALVGAIYYYMRIIKKLFKVKSNEDALKGALFFILFPGTIFFIATYTGSLFALVSLAAIYYALRGRYILPGILLAVATATHENGIFVLALVPIMLVEQREKLYKVITCFVIGSLGILSYMAFLKIRFHAPLAFVTAQKMHGWLPHGYLASLRTTFNLSDFVVIVLLLATIWYWWNKKKSFSFYTFLYLCIPFIGGQFAGFTRYILMAFPVPLMFYGRLRSTKIAYLLVVVLFAMFWTYFALQYTGGYIGS